MTSRCQLHWIFPVNVSVSVSNSLSLSLTKPQSPDNPCTECPILDVTARTDMGKQGGLYQSLTF